MRRLPAAWLLLVWGLLAAIQGVEAVKYSPAKVISALEFEAHKNGHCECKDRKALVCPKGKVCPLLRDANTVPCPCPFVIAKYKNSTKTDIADKPYHPALTANGRLFPVPRLKKKVNEEYHKAKLKAQLAARLEKKKKQAKHDKMLQQEQRKKFWKRGEARRKAKLPAEKLSFLGFYSGNRHFAAYDGLKSPSRITHPHRTSNPVEKRKPAWDMNFKVTPSKLSGRHKGKHSVTVTWSNVKNAQPHDIIALTCGGGQAKTTDILDYELVGYQLGEGTVTFKGLLNMRCDYVVRYLQSDFLFPDCHATMEQCMLEFKHDKYCKQFICSPHCGFNQHKTVYGGDGNRKTYHWKSSICGAAYHAGAIGDKGGPVTMRIDPGMSNHIYRGSLRHGIKSISTPVPPQYTFMPHTSRHHPEGVHALAGRRVVLDWKKTSPQYIRLALTDRPNQLRVLWTSGTRAMKPHPPVVLFGKKKSQLKNQEHHAVVGHLRTYRASDMCHSPANLTSQALYRDPGYTSDVLLRDIKPGKYYYKVGNALDGWSKVHEFIMPARPNAKMSVSFAAFGELGVNRMTAAGATIEQIAKRKKELDFILHMGDLSYARGEGFMWEQFMDLISPVAHRVPYMVSIGSHDYDYKASKHANSKDPSKPGKPFLPKWGKKAYYPGSGGECAVPVVARFSGPKNGHGLFWNSFNAGNVHIVRISAEHNVSVGSKQYRWLEEDLQKVNRHVTPFVVLVTPRPLYTSIPAALHNYVVSDHLYRSLEPLLAKHKVDLVLSAHFRGYERTCPILHRVCNDKAGIVHITAGTGGASLDEGIFKKRDPFGRDQLWSKAHKLEFGFLVVKTAGKRLMINFHRSSDGSIRDTHIMHSRY